MGARYNLRYSKSGDSKENSITNVSKLPQFSHFYVDFVNDGCGTVLRSKKKFSPGEKLMDLCGSYICEPLDAIKLYQKCQEYPKLHRRKFFVQSNYSFYCCDMENSFNEPCYYLLQRRINGFNCRPIIYYSDDDVNKLRPKISIKATTLIRKGDPIIVYYGLLVPFFKNRTIYSSSLNFKTRSKFVTPIRLNKQKSSKKSVNFYEDTSLLEFATAGDLDFNEVSERLININEKYEKYLETTVPLHKEVVLDLASCFNIKPIFKKRPSKINKSLEDDEDVVYPQPLPDAKDCVKRAPVVTIMGHVDHGKTTLLDALRSSRIVDSEHGGITQHIGAFSVKLKNSDSKITFLDTPGHAAFKKMRQRGAMSTDIVVLVVAADDGVNEQTIESIKYAKEAGVPIVVAINKCDKPTANTKLTRRNLMEHDIIVEDMGGDVQVVEISALYKKNIDKLQEALISLADIMNLKSTFKGLVEGIIIESSTVQGLGKVCSLIVQRGTLKKGSIIVCGTSWGKIKTMTDEFGKPIKEAGPSTPVRITGWRGDYLPSPGEKVLEVEDEVKAQKIVNFREKKKIDLFTEKEYKVIDEKMKIERNIYLQNKKVLMDEGKRFASTVRNVICKNARFKREVDSDELKLNLMLRSDVDGTLEAILNVIDTYNSDKCELNLVDFGVGPPIENHIELAIETNSLIYCFNTPISTNLKEMAIRNNIKLEQFLVIYRLIESLKNELSNLLPPIREMKQVAEGHVLKEFIIAHHSNKKKVVAGTLVDWGVFNKNKLFRISRGTDIIYEGTVESLKCGKEFVNEVKTNCEVGISVPDTTVRFKEDDTVEVFDEIKDTENVTIICTTFSIFSYNLLLNMPPKRRQRRLLNRISEEEQPNKFLQQLSADDFILEPSSVVFSDVLPDYETLEDKVAEIQDIYDEATLDCYEETQRLLKEQREKLKELILKENSDIKIPKTPARGKNVSKIAKMYETIEDRKDRMTRKNLFTNTNMSYGNNAVEIPKPGIVADLRSKFANRHNGNNGVFRDTKGISVPSNRTLAAPKKNRDTTERAILLMQQDSSLRRADMKKQNLLKEKAERTKKEREEKTKQVEERRRLKEQEREEKLREIKEKEDRIREFQNQRRTPRTPNGNCFKTPISTVSRPKLVSKNTIDETPMSQMGRTFTNKSENRTIVDKSCDITEATYETPVIPRKRKADSMRKEELFSEPNRKSNRFLFTENVTPEITFNCTEAINSKINTHNDDQFKKFEAQMKSIDVTDMFSSPLFNSTKIDASLIQRVEYEMTPDKVPQPSTEDDYNIKDLSEGDGTDDEDNPRKVVPKWAREENLLLALKKQYRKYGKSADFTTIFGKVREFKIENIFKGKNYARTSSAFWSSPLCDSTQAQAIYYQLSESIADNSLYND
ncbi:Translation initiation factor IF-2, mitochondrial [Strongyloides ratti]|uniref:Translation initiation factor IF-2, mitochondrial n=1 Tax=Strongyloides ratti TaxID=34506 RepID=A0A090MXB3_STRRB|nr:Translation initiation factor IF-2, mitochondrial [Strongyloides ratti]CEF65134.1 Translation initiation factor IF-2, mitochondrial [Strongyloides ratti]